MLLQKQAAKRLAHPIPAAPHLDSPCIHFGSSMRGVAGTAAADTAAAVKISCANKIADRM